MPCNPFHFAFSLKLNFPRARYPQQYILLSPVSPGPAHVPEDLHVNPASAAPSALILSRIPCRAASLPRRISAGQYSASRLAAAVPALATWKGQLWADSFGRRAVIRTTGTFGHASAGRRRNLAAMCWRGFWHMRCLSPHKQVSDRALGQIEITRFGLWDPNTSLSSAFGLDRSTIPAEGSKNHEISGAGAY